MTESKGKLILFDAPIGYGKTYVAKRIAAKVTS